MKRHSQAAPSIGSGKCNSSNGGRGRTASAALIIAVAAAVESKSSATTTLVVQFQSEVVMAKKFIQLMLEAVEIMMAVVPAVVTGVDGRIAMGDAVGVTGVFWPERSGRWAE